MAAFRTHVGDSGSLIDHLKADKVDKSATMAGSGTSPSFPCRQFIVSSCLMPTVIACSRGVVFRLTLRHLRTSSCRRLHSCRETSIRMKNGSGSKIDFRHYCPILVGVCVRLRGLRVELKANSGVNQESF